MASPQHNRPGLPSLNSPLNGNRQTSPVDTDTVDGSSDQANAPRLKGTNIMVTPESPIAGAFRSVTDYSKINSETHQALRSDTFGTPTKLNSRYHTPSRLDRKKAMDDPVEFQRRMIKMVHEMQVVQKDQQESMSMLRQDMTDSLSQHDTAHGILRGIRELTDVLEHKSRQPLDLSSVLEELQSVRMVTSERQDRMESRISEQMREIIQEIHMVRKQQEEAEKAHLVKMREEIINVRLVPEVKDIACRSEMQLGDVLKLTQSVSADTTRTTRGVKELQDDQSRIAQDLAVLVKENQQHHADIVPCLQDQFSTYLQKNFVNVDFHEILGVLCRTRSSIKEGHDQILSEIARVQQALHLDFARIVDEMTDGLRSSVDDEPPAVAVSTTGGGDVRKSFSIKALVMHAAETTKALKTAEEERDLALASAEEKPRPRKRFRHFWAQTEDPPKGDAAAQTDDEMWKAGKPKRKFDRAKDEERKPKHELVRAQTGKDKAAAMKNRKQNDAESMKNRVRAKAMQPQYNVVDCYWETGCSRTIASHPYFENFTLVVILLNVIWIGVDTDHNDAAMLIDADPIFQIVENTFCTFFSFELLIRFLAFKIKKNCLRDFWFVFDSVLVTVMIVETWILTIVMSVVENRPSGGVGGLSILRVFRFARVVRVSRLARLLRAIPEILVLMKGISIAIRSVLVFFCLWLVIIFVFAILFRQLTEDEDIGRRRFRSMPVAMNTLLLNGLLPTFANLVNDVTGDNPIYWVLIMSFIGIAFLTLMHMLIGVLVETIFIVSVVEREDVAVKYVSSQLRYILIACEYDPVAMNMRKADFQNFIREPEMNKLFVDEGVCMESLIDMADIMFQDLEDSGKGGLSYEMLVDIILNMRGANPATVKDVREQMRLFKAIVGDAMAAMHEDIVGDLDNLKKELEVVIEAHTADDVHSEVSGDWMGHAGTESHHRFTPPISLDLSR